ncbi:GerAB/ArcD/ProY family transporter [Paenibacillus sp. BC26]|uniref:GerAB/ArcD/ProY family transporter n=1 Tax=Paenibacillus sp. BC26 TaxID=1881032 RepID=UPI0008F2044E|nr:GerAB/ArcD/ProY family transporter [Paenibacillus sp. BC26]SFT20275.1 Spore germination protein [Paenibacillus sp. BC26]
MHRWVATMTAPIFFLAAHCSILFAAFTRSMLETTEYGHWEPVCLSMGIELFLLLLLLLGLRKAGNKDYGDLFLPLGKWISAALIVPLSGFIMLIPILALRYFAELMIIVFISSSPLHVILAVLCLLMFFGASIGPQGIMRGSTLLTLINFPVLLFAIFACFQNAKFVRVYPLINPSMDFLSNSTFLITLFSICPFLLLGMLPPVCKVKIRPILISFVLISLLHVVVLYVPIVIYGLNAAKIMNFPLMTSFDSVNITWTVFNRISLFYAVALLAFVMTLSSFSLWSSALLIRKLIPAWRETYIRISLSLITFLISFIIPSWNDYIRVFAADTWFRLLIYAVIPIAVFLRGRSVAAQEGKRVLTE